MAGAVRKLPGQRRTPVSVRPAARRSAGTARSRARARSPRSTSGSRVQPPSVAVDALRRATPGSRPPLRARRSSSREPELDLHRLPQLGRDQAAERVAREVAEAAGAPVHVLQAAERVGGDLDAEQAPHPLAPRRRQVGDREVALDQRELELEAQDDVQRIGQRIGGDADRASARRRPARRAARRPRPRSRRRPARPPAPRRTRDCAPRGSPTACSGTRGSTSTSRIRGWCARAPGRSGARRARGRTRAAS